MRRPLSAEDSARVGLAQSQRGLASSIACSHAAAVVAAATGPAATRKPNGSGSDREEDGLIVALQADVEPVAGRLVAVGDQAASAVVADGRQCRVGGVGVELVTEVQPGDDTVEQPAGEDRDHEVRRLRRTVTGRHGRGGLTRADRPRDPSASVAERPKCPSICHVSTRASPTGAPSPSSTRPRDVEGARGALRHGRRGGGVGQGDVQERADRLGRRDGRAAQPSWSVSSGVRAGPRSTMSKR